jgi:hypothetical protein
MISPQPRLLLSFIKLIFKNTADSRRQIDGVRLGKKFVYIEFIQKLNLKTGLIQMADIYARLKFKICGMTL